MSFSDYLEDAILNATLRGVTFPTPPTTIYVSLHTATPSESAGSNELVSGTSPGYARVAVANGGWSAPTTVGSTRQSSNTGVITFPQASGDWAAAVTHFALFDASSGGNLLYAGSLGSARTVKSGDQPRFPAGGLVVQVD